MKGTSAGGSDDSMLILGEREGRCDGVAADCNVGDGVGIAEGCAEGLKDDGRGVDSAAGDEVGKAVGCFVIALPAHSCWL